MAVYNNPTAATAALESLLKTYYVDKVQNLLFRNSPTVKAIKKMRIEGKEAAFPAVYSRGGAVAADFLVAKNNAATNVKNAEFKVTPGQLYSVFSYNKKEVQASLTKKGAYMKIAGNKAFAATEAFRKTLAAAFFSKGYGELQNVTGLNLTANTQSVITLADSVLMKIDVGSQLAVKTTAKTVASLAKLSVDAINGNQVTVTPDTTYAGDGVLVLDGSIDNSGNPMLPIGIDAWIPVTGYRDDSDAAYTAEINTPFFNVTRSLNVEGLAGQFVDGSAETKINTVVQKLLQKCRRKGLDNENVMLVMNDSDWLKLANEIESTNTYFTQTTTKDKRKANIGLNEISAGFSTNYIDIIYDDPYCPEGKAYILDRDTVQFWSFNDVEGVLNDTISENNPGKQDPEEFDNKGHEDDPYKLIIDDYLTVDQGQDTSDGPASRVTLGVVGSFVVLDPSVNGVAILPGYTNVIGK